jgi:hypothetical protein
MATLVVGTDDRADAQGLLRRFRRGVPRVRRYFQEHDPAEVAAASTKRFG